MGETQMDGRRLEIKAELARRGMKHRDLARELRKRGLPTEEREIAYIINGRRNPSEEMRQAISEILGRPTYILFA